MKEISSVRSNKEPVQQIKPNAKVSKFQFLKKDLSRAHNNSQVSINQKVKKPRNKPTCDTPKFKEVSLRSMCSTKNILDKRAHDYKVMVSPTHSAV